MFFGYNINMKRYNGILFILPAMLGICIFLIIPILCSFGLSFFDWDLLNEITFVGLNNYISILTEQDFLKIFTNTIVFSLSATIFAVIIPLIIATILNSKIKWRILW